MQEVQILTSGEAIAPVEFEGENTPEATSTSTTKTPIEAAPAAALADAPADAPADATAVSNRAEAPINPSNGSSDESSLPLWVVLSIAGAGILLLLVLVFALGCIWSRQRAMHHAFHGYESSRMHDMHSLDVRPKVIKQNHSFAFKSSSEGSSRGGTSSTSVVALVGAPRTRGAGAPHAHMHDHAVSSHEANFPHTKASSHELEEGGKVYHVQSTSRGGVMKSLPPGATSPSANSSQSSPNKPKGTRLGPWKIHSPAKSVDMQGSVSRTLGSSPLNAVLVDEIQSATCPTSTNAPTGVSNRGGAFNSRNAVDSYICLLYTSPSPRD